MSLYIKDCLVAGLNLLTPRLLDFTSIRSSGLHHGKEDAWKMAK